MFLQLSFVSVICGKTLMLKVQSVMWFMMCMVCDVF